MKQMRRYKNGDKPTVAEFNNIAKNIELIATAQGKRVSVARLEPNEVVGAAYLNSVARGIDTITVGAYGKRFKNDDWVFAYTLNEIIDYIRSCSLRRNERDENINRPSPNAG